MTPYFNEAGIVLYLGDSREIMPWITGASLVLADPPYGDTSLEWDRWPDGWAQAAFDAAPQLWCFGSMRMFRERFGDFAQWQLGPDVVWRKQNGAGFDNKRPRKVHEHALHFYRGKWGDLTWNPQYTNDAVAKRVHRRTRPTHMGHIENGIYESHDGGPRLLTSVIEVANMHGKAIHPTEKPLGILEPLIRYSTNPGDLVIDPFGGSCSTARAALATGRRAICIERREDYLERAALALQASQVAS